MRDKLAAIGWEAVGSTPGEMRERVVADTKVWGDDVEEFRPERFAPEAMEKLPPNAWKALAPMSCTRELPRTIALPTVR